jgi:hypothetical protein
MTDGFIQAADLLPPGTSPDSPATLVGHDSAGGLIQKTFANSAILNVWLASYEAQTAQEISRVVPGSGS